MSQLDLYIQIVHEQQSRVTCLTTTSTARSTDQCFFQAVQNQMRLWHSWRMRRKGTGRPAHYTHAHMQCLYWMVKGRQTSGVLYAYVIRS